MSEYTGPERRKTGRPRVTPGAASSVVSVRIGSDHHDTLVKMASERRTTVADLLRTILHRAARPRPH